MLHKVPDSKYRRPMLRLVVLQRRLALALCELPANTTKSDADWVTWLTTDVWPAIDTTWIGRFWNNDRGRRKQLIRTVAAAADAAKSDLLDTMRQQHAVKNLYMAGNGSTINKTDKDYWNHSPAHKAMRSLMVHFYHICLVGRDGCPESRTGNRLGPLGLDIRQERCNSVCPYVDLEYLHAELDHFLPKNQFPFLSVHPDNLIACCHDANVSRVKGTKVGMDWNSPRPAEDYFHPRWRSAVDGVGSHATMLFSIDLLEQRNRIAGIQLVAANAADGPRIANMDEMFHHAEHWGRTVDSDLQDIQDAVVEWLTDDQAVPDAASVGDRLTRYAQQQKRAIGKRSRAIYWSQLPLCMQTRNHLVTSIAAKAARNMGTP